MTSVSRPSGPPLRGGPKGHRCAAPVPSAASRGGADSCHTWMWLARVLLVRLGRAVLRRWCRRMDTGSRRLFAGRLRRWTRTRVTGGCDGRGYCSWAVVLRWRGAWEHVAPAGGRGRCRNGVRSAGARDGLARWRGLGQERGGWRTLFLVRTHQEVAHPSRVGQLNSARVGRLALRPGSRRSTAPGCAVSGTFRSAGGFLFPEIACGLTELTTEFI
jgi:hypothetical protein